MRDEPLERELADFLDARDPGPPPARLRDRVAAVPTRAGRRPARLLPLLESAAAAIVLVGLGGVLLLLGTASPAGPGASPGIPSPTTIRPGAGLAEPAPPILPAIISGAMLTGGYLLARRFGRRRLLVRGVAVGLATAYVVAAATPAGFQVYGFGAEPVTTVDSEGGEVRYVVTAGPGEPFRILLAMASTSPIPVSVLGLDARTSPGGVYRLVALARQPDPSSLTYDGMVAFEPVHVGPGGGLTVGVFGEAGPCAGRAPGSAYAVITELDLVTSRLGWEQTTRVPLDARVEVPVRDDCVP